MVDVQWVWSMYGGYGWCIVGVADVQWVWSMWGMCSIHSGYRDSSKSISRALADWISQSSDFFLLRNLHWREHSIPYSLHTNQNLQIIILAAYWLYTSCILAAYRLHTGCILAAYWLHTGCILAVHWTYTGCILAAYWLHTGCILAAYWLYTSCTLDIYWLHTGCILAAY